jgi:glycine/D-amino acid oxidase-like deaminating enzyme
MPKNVLADGRRTADIVVIGDGIVGLSTALELGRRGARCIVLGAHRPGNASFAAAGLLAPSIGQLPPFAQSFFSASLALYPQLLSSLAEFDAGLALVRGLLVLSETGGHALPAGAGESVSPQRVREWEPHVAAPQGATLFADDGAIDNVRLMRALRLAIDRERNAELMAETPASFVELGHDRVVIGARSGLRFEARRAILAAGAWSPQIDGLPRPVPIFPLKGQMLAFGTAVLEHPVMGNGVYLVPREDETVVGSTSEHAGFDVSTTGDTLERLRASAVNVCPALGRVTPTSAWAGIRPATPDMLPILGADPEHPELLYASGHSRNGILLAPATAQAIADLVLSGKAGFDLSGFGIARFESSPGSTNLIPDA